jgi:hypothetical protein
MPRDARTAAPPTDDIVVMDDIRKVYDTGKVKVEALKGSRSRSGRASSSRSSGRPARGSPRS